MNKYTFLLPRRFYTRENIYARMPRHPHEPYYTTRKDQYNLPSFLHEKIINYSPLITINKNTFERKYHVPKIMLRKIYTDEGT